VLEQRVDTFIDVVTFSGYLTTYRKGLSMPFSINMRLKPSDLLLPKVRVIFEPFKDTMEVKTFYEVFNIPPAVYNNLVMPKGIGTINTLPVDFVTVYYQTQESWQKGYAPTSMDINYRSPAFNFMPKISF